MSGRKNKKDKSANKENSKLGYQIQPGKLCLNMIVKNEAHLKPLDPRSPNPGPMMPVIKRCLDNVGHLLDAIAIVDTGSTDKTIDIIKVWAEEKKIPCEVIVDLWRDDFGYSRSLALDHGMAVVEKIKRKELKYSENLKAGDLWYYLFMDADNLAYDDDGISPIRLNKERLGADAYEVQMRQNLSQYGYLWLAKIDPKKPWKWYGPRHEYCSPLKDADKKLTWEAKFGKIDGGYIDSRREGNRASDSRKYLRDALVFEKALLDNPMDDRYLYYVAQSYKDAAREINQEALREKAKVDNKELPETERNEAEQKYQQLGQQAAILWQRAEKAYVYRASVSPFHLWNDEYTYCAWVEAGKIRKFRKGFYDNKCLEYFYAAFQKRPQRLEAAYYILNHYLMAKAFQVGWTFAKDLVRMPYPKDEHIFVDDDIHNYSFAFEASLCAFYANAKDEFVSLSKKVLRNPKTPENIKAATETNLKKFGKA